MSKTVYLIRHCEPDFGEAGALCIGRTDLPVSTWGRRQADKLSEYFANKEITKVYHSGLMRSKQTAQILSGGNFPVLKAANIEEIDMGEWEGMTYEEIRHKYPSLYEMRGKDIMRIAPPGGESFLQCLSRFKEAVRGIADKAHGNIIITAHAGVNRVFLCEALGMNLEQALLIPQPYGCINMLKYDGDRFSVQFYGRMPSDAPDNEERKRLYERCKTAKEVILHCQAVNKKALQITEALRHSVCLNTELIESAALLHDVARAEKNHAAAGYKLLMQSGYPLVAEIIRSHHELEQKDLECLTESAIVFYADKLICGTEEVTLCERFSGSLNKCADADARIAHERRYNQAAAVRDLISSYV